MLTSLPKLTLNANCWQLEIYIDQIRHRFTLCPAKEPKYKAKELALQKHNELFLEHYGSEIKYKPKPQNITLKDALNQALENTKPNLSPATLKVKNSALKYFLEWIDAHYEHIPAKDLTAQMINQFIDHRYGINQASSVNKEISAIKPLLNNMIDNGIIDTDFRKIKKLKVVNKETDVYTIAECETLIEVAKVHNKPMAGLLGMILYGFIRPSEIMRLTWEDINLEESYITVNSEKSKTKVQGKVVINSKLKTLLDDEKDKTGLFFKACKARQTLDDYFHRLVALAGLRPGPTFYTLKRTGTSQLFKKTNNLKLVQKQCRHAKSATTEIYLNDYSVFDMLGMIEF